MGIHVSRSSRGAVVRYVQRRGDKGRPQIRRPGKSGGGSSGSAQTQVKTGGSSGTRGDFGADFE